MQLSVIILNYNVRYFLELCVLSVQKAVENLDAEIIVVDNNSQDDSCEMIKTRFPDVRLIRNAENLGFPKGNNIGVAAASGEYICILNPDTVVAEDTFIKVIAFAEEQQNLGIIGVRLIDGTGHFLPESKRGTPTPFVAFTKISGLYKVLPKQFGKYYANHLTELQSGKVDILVGAFMVLKRDLYSESGGFDENCFMYSDDIDLSYSILKSGNSNYYFADTTVIHYKGESTVRDETYMKRFREAMNFFYQKHFRLSGAFDLFMRTGAFIFANYKKGQAVAAKRNIRHYVLLSTNETLKNQLQHQTGKSITVINPSNEKDLLNVLNTDETEVVFDNDSYDFRSIIQKMELYSGLNFTFKIRPINRDFIIGSNSSNDRGEVINIATRNKL
jgi:GT2 family glycosyltransferase